MYYFDTITILFQCFCCCSEEPKSQAAKAPMSKLQSVWECCIDGTWSAYESSDNAKIDVHFRQSPNTQLRTQFSFSPTTVYIIDFDTMSQINTTTQAKRPIRWKPGGYPACWECKIDGRWVSYNAKDTMTISMQFEISPNSSAPVALSFNNEQYTIDFGRMVQINRATKAQRPIRARPASAPAPALSPAPTAPGAPAQDLAALRAVVEHLFSDASLAHDAYLHGRLAQAPGGWLRIDDILHFRRMLALSATASSVQQAVRGSAVVETQVPAARPASRHPPLSLRAHANAAIPLTGARERSRALLPLCSAWESATHALRFRLPAQRILSGTRAAACPDATTPRRLPRSPPSTSAGRCPRLLPATSPAVPTQASRPRAGPAVPRRPRAPPAVAVAGPPW